MPAYFVLHFSIRDPETFAKYPAEATASVAKYGGKLIVAAGAPGMQEVQVAEGRPQHGITAIVEFESLEAAQRWYKSSEYSAPKKLRTSSTEGWALFAPGFVPPQQ